MNSEKNWSDLELHDSRNSTADRGYIRICKNCIYLSAKLLEEDGVRKEDDLYCALYFSKVNNAIIIKLSYTIESGYFVASKTNGKLQRSRSISCSKFLRKYDINKSDRIVVNKEYIENIGDVYVAYL